ncbi:hypothetical protein FSP39_011657 [Pinctada imbricata]|uniref:G-protein coupled receptors family 1 profile domain-containing protein n=1 Tax=Pinctada imbricata TaxID=66713 RepID=A0AA89CBS4_PINIB|nr:hypothetical protein FSP39_011657 [Pinctada imbricata]
MASSLIIDLMNALNHTTPTPDYGIRDPKGINRIPAIVFSWVLVVFGTIGNGHALILNIQRFREQTSTKQRKSPYVVFVLSLAILDLFTCVLILPLDTIDISTQFAILSVSVCKLFRFFQFFLHASSILQVTLICIHCWRKVFYPKRRQIQRRLAFKLCLVCYLIAVPIAIPSAVLAGYSTKTINGESGPICFTVSDAYSDAMPPKVYSGFLAFAFVTCLIIICSFYIALIRYYCQVRQERMAVENGTKTSKQPGKTTFTLLILTLVFLVSYLPFLIIAFIVVVKSDFRKGWNIATFATYRVFVRFPYLNNVLNPVVYGCEDHEFRKRLKQKYAPLLEKVSF